MTKINEVFSFYNDFVKPLYSEIEAENNDLPVELLFEIHAAFDHLKRYYIGEEKEEICCSKAISHLKRGAWIPLSLSSNTSMRVFKSY